MENNVLQLTAAQRRRRQFQLARGWGGYTRHLLGVFGLDAPAMQLAPDCPQCGEPVDQCDCPPIALADARRAGWLNKE